MRIGVQKERIDNMNYFNIPIDNDITYILKEIGHNIKVNNIPAKAIINNSSMERTYDDKKIITHEELKRGQYINYNDLFFILLNEVNDKRYLTYYKGIMRRCNFSIKFIVDDRLFQFPSIIESENLYLSDDYLMPTLKHTLTVTLPLTQITRQLKTEQSFMKWGQKWQIQGRDYTKDGLLILNCERISTSHLDDKENEIADRWLEGNKDKLNGNITPILPFEKINFDKEIVSIAPLTNIEVEFGTAIEEIELPTVATVTLDDTTTIELGITWDTSSYNGDEPGTYTFYGTLELVEGVANTGNHKAQIRVAVDEDVEDFAIYLVEIEKEYGGDTDFELSSQNWQKYHIKKIVGDAEVPGNFDFALSDDLNGALLLTKESNNSCKIFVPTLYGGAIDIMLIVTDTDIDEIVIEQVITIKRR